MKKDDHIGGIHFLTHRHLRTGTEPWCWPAFIDSEISSHSIVCSHTTWESKNMGFTSPVCAAPCPILRPPSSECRKIHTAMLLNADSHGCWDCCSVLEAQTLEIILPIQSHFLKRLGKHQGTRPHHNFLILSHRSVQLNRTFGNNEHFFPCLPIG